MPISDLIVHDKRPVTLVGGGKVKKSLLQAAIVHGPRVIAADGGAAAALAAGVMPEAVIGDFDSLDVATRAAIPAERLHRIAEQESTDFEKCLERIEAPLVIGVGFGGGRVDHHLAALHALMRFADRPCLLLGRKDAVFLLPPRLTLDLPAGCRVSLFPMAPVAARSKGLRWPLDGLDLAPGRRIGTSNEATDRVELEADAPALVAILPVGQMVPLIAALSAPGLARWPGAR